MRSALKGSPGFRTAFRQMMEVIFIWWASGRDPLPVHNALHLKIDKHTQTSAAYEIVSDLKRIKLHSMREQLCLLWMRCYMARQRIASVNEGLLFVAFLQTSSLYCALWHVIMAITSARHQGWRNLNARALAQCPCRRLARSAADRCTFCIASTILVRIRTFLRHSASRSFRYDVWHCPASINSRYNDPIDCTTNSSQWIAATEQSVRYDSRNPFARRYERHRFWIIVYFALRDRRVPMLEHTFTKHSTPITNAFCHHSIYVCDLNNAICNGGMRRAFWLSSIAVAIPVCLPLHGQHLW